MIRIYKRIRYYHGNYFQSDDGEIESMAAALLCSVYTENVDVEKNTLFFDRFEKENLKQLRNDDPIFYFRIRFFDYR